MTTRATFLALAAAGAAALASPPHATAAEARDHLRPVSLESFESCTELVRYGARHRRRYAHPLGVHGRPMTALMAPTAARGVADADGSAPAVGGAGGGSFSTTNVQEAGVDEPDIVKTDGARILALARGRLYAVDATAQQPRLLGSLRLGESWDHQMLVHGDKVLVAWTRWRKSNGQEETVLAELDVSDPAAMRIVKTLSVDGHFISARMTGSTARVVIASSPRAITLPQDSRRRGRAAQWLPAAELRDRVSGRRERHAAVACRDVRHAPVFSGLDMITVLTIDLARGLEPVDTDTVMTDADTVYGSPSGLYVATSRWLRPGARTLPKSLGTTIHRFDTADPTRTSYRGSGVVPGHLLNQFSMSEHEGVLRVASSATPDWWDAGAERGDSESFVTTLRPDPVTGELLQDGGVGGLGRGERIYAVRFIGTVGYVVTFRETDPLYTIDLSDPSRPRVMGELKIRGYSAYLHPAGDGLLIGVGQDATSRGRTLGTQVSLFDVSDPANPTRLQQRTLGDGSSSEVEYDHHAFLWWPQSGLAVLPVTAWNEEAGPDSAAVGLRIDRASGISEVGRVTHPRRAGEDGVIRRSLVAGARLYTLSDRGLRASSLDTLAQSGWVEFD